MKAFFLKKATCIYGKNLFESGIYLHKRGIEKMEIVMLL